MMVVDASVAVKWFLQEEESEQAVELMTTDHKLIGPVLAQYEVAGALVRAWRREDIDVKTLTLCRDRWLHSIATNVMRLEDDQRDIIRGTELTTELYHPLADCIYLAMAERLDCLFVTADEVFYERARATSEHILLLRDALVRAA